MCPEALYSWCMRVVLSATRCVLNLDHILRYSGALCRGRALACDNLVGLPHAGALLIHRTPDRRIYDILYVNSEQL